MNDTMPSKDEMELPEGWKWDNEWNVDMNRGVDDEGMSFLSCYIFSCVI